MMKSSLVCLLSQKLSKTQFMLWHRRLNHLNFGTINDLAQKDLVRGLPRLKFEKDHLCSACQHGKRKKYSHKPKSENTNMGVLHTLHIDLCGPMRVQSINRNKYILAIVDDYLRFIWEKFLRSKDETPEFLINFLKQIQVSLNKIVRYIRTDNRTEFVNQVMSKYYEGVGIFHQKSNRELLNKTALSKGVVERQNRTLVEAARTMLILLKAPMFLWAVAIATALFGALCYPTNDSEDLGKLQAKADIGIFIGYAPNRKGFRIYDKRTRRIMETIHVTFDELHRTSNSLTRVEEPVHSATAVNAHVVPPGTSVSTTFAQDAPSTSFSPSSFGIQPPVIQHDVASSSGDVSIAEPNQVTQPSDHLRKWSKDHPLDNIVRNPSRPVSTRKQLASDALWCCFHTELSKVKPKNFKMVVTKDSWFEAMQNEIREFDHLKVWVLVPKLKGVMIIALKWIYKVKLGEYGDILKKQSSVSSKEISSRRGSEELHQAATRFSIWGMHVILKTAVPDNGIMNPQESEQVIARDELWVPSAERIKGSESYEFLLADKRCVIDAEVFRKILDICPRKEGEDFTEVQNDEDTLTFLVDLGYSRPLHKYTNMFVDHMHQPLRTLAACINKCLSGKTDSNDKLRKSRIDILWGHVL
ncbi:putative ribonuclease H-like domain-containing protein [Tanacetum coccineum]